MARGVKKGTTKKGHVRLVAQVTTKQLAGVLGEAERRRRPGKVRADVSAVVRDALAAWLAKRR